INWTTNEPSTSFIEYSTADGFSSGTVNGSYELVTTHSVNLPSILNPDTTYYYKIHSKDASGNEAVSAQMDFHTLALGDLTAPVISNIATPLITHNSATISWSTDEGANSYVEYGETVGYGSIFGSENLVDNHSIILPSTLTPEVTYHYRVKSKDASGNESISGDYTFTTLIDPQDITAPTLTSGPTISGVTATTATITWTTDEISDSKVGYSQAMGSFTLEQGS
ncbi:MAG TPA: hypothetical protein DIC35_01915, partial [Candidatus Moranbacteria bacterium]|nr:hypothetical protein [Candidatus Moranbacteria bacterium]